MVALAAERLRKARGPAGNSLNLPVKAASQIFRGGLMASVAGVAIAARAATTRAELSTLRVVGLAVDSALGGGADGDVRTDAEAGIFQFANGAAGDAITAADLGNPCFAIDDQTVGKTTGGGMRAQAGRIVDVDADGVWVEVGEAKPPRRVVLPFFISEADTIAHTPTELVSPVAGAISLLDVTVQKAVTTGGAVTVNVGATAVAGLAANVANGAAKGTIYSATPTPGDATTVVAEGSRIQIIPGAAFATAGAISGFLEITY